MPDLIKEKTFSLVELIVEDENGEKYEVSSDYVNEIGGLRMEDRLEALEIKVSYQEDLIEVLNQRVIEQQKLIDGLVRQSEAFRKQIESLTPLLGMRPQDEPPPPHY